MTYLIHKYQALLEEIAKLGEKKRTDERTGIEETFEVFNYSEILQKLTEKQVPQEDVVRLLRDLLVAHLSCGVAKLLTEGGIGQEAMMCLDVSAIENIVNLLKNTVELENLMVPKFPWTLNTAGKDEQ